MNVFVVPGLAEGGEVLARIAIQKQLVVDDLEDGIRHRFIFRKVLSLGNALQGFGAEQRIDQSLRQSVRVSHDNLHQKKFSIPIRL